MRNEKIRKMKWVRFSEIIFEDDLNSYVQFTHT